MARTLIIGGTSFIGRHIAEKMLALGHEVTLLNRGNNQVEFSAPVEYLTADRKDFTQVKRAIGDRSFDYVIDMVGFEVADIKELVEFLNGRIERYVFASTIDVYKVDNPIPMTEASPLKDDPADRYGYNKARCEEFLQRAYAEKGFPAVIIRFPSVYGEYDYLQREWFIVKRLLDGRQRIAMADGGLGIEHRVYAKDIAHAIGLCLNAGEHILGQSYHIGHTHVMPARDLALLTAKVMQVEFEPVSVPAKLLPWRNPYNMNPPMVLDLTKIRRDLGFEEQYSQKEALRNTVEWLVSNQPQEWRWARNYRHDPFDYELEDQIIAAVESIRNE